MVCVMRNTYLSICPTAHFSLLQRERVQAFGGLVGCFCVLCLVSPFFFSVASSITYLFALCFPYREGVEGAFVFSFRNILAIPCVAMVVIPLFAIPCYATLQNCQSHGCSRLQRLESVLSKSASAHCGHLAARSSEISTIFDLFSPLFKVF